MFQGSIGMSEQIGELIDSLCKARSEMEPAKTNSKANYGSYADLLSVIQSFEKPLAKNGLYVTQEPFDEDGKLYLLTMISHKSGQYKWSKMIVDWDQAGSRLNRLQSKGSALTYTKRYALSSLLCIGIESEDDDGEKSGQPPYEEQEQRPQNKTSYNGKATEGQLKFLVGIVSKSEDVKNSVLEACKKNLGISRLEDIPRDSFQSVLDYAKQLAGVK